LNAAATTTETIAEKHNDMAAQKRFQNKNNKIATAALSAGMRRHYQDKGLRGMRNPTWKPRKQQHAVLAMPVARRTWRRHGVDRAAAEQAEERRKL
jgi:hypothetical protein